MSFTTTVENGVIRLPPEAKLPDGTLVQVEPITSPEAVTALHQRWVDEGLASGPATPLTRAEMDAARDRVLGRKNAR
jgi:hypothetical protein